MPAFLFALAFVSCCVYASVFANLCSFACMFVSVGLCKFVSICVCVSVFALAECLPSRVSVPWFLSQSFHVGMLLCMPLFLPLSSHTSAFVCLVSLASSQPVSVRISPFLLVSFCFLRAYLCLCLRRCVFLCYCFCPGPCIISCACVCVGHFVLTSGCFFATASFLSLSLWFCLYVQNTDTVSSTVSVQYTWKLTNPLCAWCSVHTGGYTYVERGRPRAAAAAAMGSPSDSQISAPPSQGNHHSPP